MTKRLDHTKYEILHFDFTHFNILADMPVS